MPLSDFLDDMTQPAPVILDVKDAHGEGGSRQTGEAGTSVTTIPIGKKLDSRENVANEPHDPEELPEDVRKYVSNRYKRKSSEKTVVQKLEGKHMLSLILYLDNMAPVIKTDVYNDVARSSSMLTRIDDLEAMGIVRIYPTGRTNNKVVTMTDKGREVAKVIRKMIEITEEE